MCSLESLKCTVSAPCDSTFSRWTWIMSEFKNSALFCFISWLSSETVLKCQNLKIPLYFVLSPDFHLRQSRAYMRKYKRASWDHVYRYSATTRLTYIRWLRYIHSVNWIVKFTFKLKGIWSYCQFHFDHKSKGIPFVS